MIEFKLLEKEHIYEAEKLRYQAFGIFEEPNDTFYQKRLESGQELGFLLYDDGKLRAGCYISYFMETIQIDYVFVDLAYQHTSKKYGYQILQKVLNSKDLIEEYFGEDIKKYSLEYTSEGSKKLYEKAGFKEIGSMGKMYRSF